MMTACWNQQDTCNLINNSCSCQVGLITASETATEAQPFAGAAWQMTDNRLRPTSQPNCTVLPRADICRRYR